MSGIDCYNTNLILHAGKEFRNVIKRRGLSSAIDPPGRWLYTWESVTKDKPGRCCCHKGFVPSFNLVGAHIVLGDGTESGAASECSDDLLYGDRVFIVPLCKNCNRRYDDIFTVEFKIPILHLYNFLSDGSGMPTFNEWDWYYLNSFSPSPSSNSSDSSSGSYPSFSDRYTGSMAIRNGTAQ
jgi:hypothetical protein